MKNLQPKWSWFDIYRKGYNWKYAEKVIMAAILNNKIDTNNPYLLFKNKRYLNLTSWHDKRRAYHYDYVDKTHYANVIAKNI